MVKLWGFTLGMMIKKCILDLFLNWKFERVNGETNGSLVVYEASPGKLLSVFNSGRR